MPLINTLGMQVVQTAVEAVPLLDTRGSISGAMPLPVSRTRTIAASPSRAAESSPARR